jgi:hypothetical protein
VADAVQEILVRVLDSRDECCVRQVPAGRHHCVARDVACQQNAGLRVRGDFLRGAVPRGDGAGGEVPEHGTGAGFESGSGLFGPTVVGDQVAGA